MHAPQPFESEWDRKTNAWAVRLYVYHVLKHFLLLRGKRDLTPQDVIRDMVYNRFAMHFHHEMDPPLTQEETDAGVKKNPFSRMCARVIENHPDLCGKVPEKLMINGEETHLEVYLNKVQFYAEKTVGRLTHLAVSLEVATSQLAHFVDAAAQWAGLAKGAFPFMACCFDF